MCAALVFPKFSIEVLQLEVNLGRRCHEHFLLDALPASVCP
jgi:hypothetical protein